MGDAGGRRAALVPPLPLEAGEVEVRVGARDHDRRGPNSCMVLAIDQSGRRGDEHDGPRYSRTMLHGALAAALTPLTGGGSQIDEDAVEPYVDFLAGHGVDGLLTLGTTGEGVLFDLDERRLIAELFVDAGPDRVQ